MAKESIVYVGDRPNVVKQWHRRYYTFHHSKPLAVPEDFAAELLKSSRNFVTQDQFGIALDEAFGSGTIMVRRWGAVGDLIIFRAACSAFLRHSPGYRFVLRLQDRFRGIAEHDPLWAGVVSIGAADDRQYGGIVTFDQIAEQDHRGRGDVHRAGLFLEAMTNRQITIEADDWKIPVPEGVTERVRDHLRHRKILDREGKKLIALQVRGSTKAKTLPKEVLAKIIRGLRDAGHLVILVESSAGVVAGLDSDDGVYTMLDKDALHAVALMHEVDLAITMDSGALWMAHVAACPTLAILGPTRPEQRITLHPLYPQGLARSVSLNEIIDCPSCFEAAKMCNQKFTCMREQPDWSIGVGRILGEVESMLAGDVRLPVVTLDGVAQAPRV